MKKAPTHVILQAGTGSMAAAITAYITNRYSGEREIPRVIIVEPKAAACLYDSAQSGTMKCV
jgi:diaminopropionate ammonia-lyase